MNIVVERHPNKLYTATAKDEHGFKASAEGKSVGEALGSFLIRNSSRFGIKIDYRFEEDEEKNEES